MPPGLHDVPGSMPGSAAAANAARTKVLAQGLAEEPEQFVLAQAAGFGSQARQQRLKG